MVRSVEALEVSDMFGFGQLMYQSHDGLSNAYEVSCNELDLLVSLGRQQPGVLGARMMGGGFGGCTISLVKEAQLPAFSEHICEHYSKQTGLSPLIHVCTIQPGTRAINISHD